MAADDQTPIFIGVAQVEQREDDPNAAKEPLDLMVQAIEAAAQDCGLPEILQKADSVRVVRGIWGMQIRPPSGGTHRGQRC